jgi:hemerythrin-like domain-containing protein
MKPIGLLMREHRLIERVVAQLGGELGKIRQTVDITPGFIDSAVDFFRTYADRTHHGKEEDILFAELERKQLSPDHKKIMDGLVQDHIRARKTVKHLVAAKNEFLLGRSDSLTEIVTSIEDLIKLYPAHIKTEDSSFFYPSMEYFSTQEQDDMLKRFQEFNQQLIHERYQKIVEELEAGRG